MKIGIIGAGNIGGTVGRLWAEAGHSVRYGVRHPDRLRDSLAEIGATTAVGTPGEAAAFGEAVFCSTPYGAWPELAALLLPHLAGKIVIDSANPYPARDGAFAQAAIDAGQGSGRPVAALLPGCRLVRAFNSVYFKLLASEAHRDGDRVGIPLAGDDPAALDLVAALVRDAGFAPVPVGPLDRARDFDPGAPVYNTGLAGSDLARALHLSPHP